MTPIALFCGAALGKSLKVLPFFVCVLIIVITQWRWILSRRGLKIALSPVLLAFMLVHVGFAFRVSVGEGVYRFAQALSAYLFIVPFVTRYSTLPMARFFDFFTKLLIAMIAYVIVWHVANHHMVVWKYLWDTKTAYSLLPFLGLALITSKSTAGVRYGWIVMAAIAVVILLAGERKAYILLGLSVLFMLNFKNPLSYLLPFGLAGAAPLAGVIDKSGYVTRQLSTLTGFAQGEVVQTLSNKQREWQVHYILSLAQEHLLTGIGTGAYMSTFLGSYGGAKSDLIDTTIGVHGEFLRVFVENGLVGLLPWTLLLLTSAWSATLGSNGRVRSFQERRLATFLLISLIVYMFFEASDTIMLVCYCLLPHVGKLRLVTAPAPTSARVPSPQKPAQRRVPPRTAGNPI